jgi:Tfp pilus assembly protein PilX
MIHTRTTPRAKISKSQTGMVAIMVTIILMLVIGLIVLGFARISRRDQRQGLDKQLSTQAFYAAETGINDAKDIIAARIASGLPLTDKPNCQPDPGAYAALTAKSNIDAAHKVSYTCVTVKTAPSSMNFNDIGTTSHIVPVTSSSGANIDTITLNWKAIGNSTPINNCPTTPINSLTANTAAAWQCGYGVLRFDLVPTGAPGGYTQDNLLASTMTMFAVPQSSGGSNAVVYAPGGATSLFGVHCTNTDCTLRIHGLDQPQYYMRISSLYKDVSLVLSATDSAGGTLGLSGGQVQIDVTGKAQDVLRRIQVSLPLTPPTNALPDFAIESTDSVCKRFSAMQGYFEIIGVAGAGSTNPMCLNQTNP